jgi:hypothetical protein
MEPIEATLETPREVAAYFIIKRHYIADNGDIILELPSGRLQLPNFTHLCPDTSRPVKLILEIPCID